MFMVMKKRRTSPPPKPCPICGGLGIKPNVMDAEDGPECACGKPSRLQSGDCGEGHGPIPCECRDPEPLV